MKSGTSKQKSNWQFLLCCCHSHLCFLQVAWVGCEQEITWKLASTVPQSLIAEFEAGISSKQETLSTEPKYGVITHSLFTSAEPMHGDEPPEKRKKVATTNMEKGYVSCCVCSMYMSNNHFYTFLGYSQIVMMEVNPWHATQRKIRASICIVVLQVNTAVYFIGIV